MLEKLNLLLASLRMLLKEVSSWKSVMDSLGMGKNQGGCPVGLNTSNTNSTYLAYPLTWSTSGTSSV